MPGETVASRALHLVLFAMGRADVCFTRDARARVDTREAQDWIRQTIADAVGGQGRHDWTPCQTSPRKVSARVAPDFFRESALCKQMVRRAR